MNYLSVEQLSKNFNEKQLFQSISFGIDKGQKTALVGVNGCGKSTLLKIIAGLESPDQGRISFRQGIKVSILPQNPEFDDHLSVLDSVFDADHEELKVIKEYEFALWKAESDPMNAPDLTSLIERMDELQAWDYESHIKQVLGKLGIHDLGQGLAELSGGQRKRIALAKALVVEPDFLILDEPTNHLDLEVIEWLENYLATSTLSLLMVTHDRYFLDKVTNYIIELQDGVLHQYQGDYGYFLEKKSEREEREAVEVNKAKNLMKKELDWIRRQPKARGTKAKYRIDAFEVTKAKASKNLTKDAVELNFEGGRQGKKILELDQVDKSWNGQKFIDAFSYVFRRKDRIGIVGKNGVGKSTFLDVLTRKEPPDHGTLDYGATTKFGYYTQEEQVFDREQRVIDSVTEVAEIIQLSNGSTVSASQLLNQFLFPPKVQHQPIGKLSGGEKRRLQLLRVLIENPNFLILDEPTNDLDLATLNVLEEYLDNFDGSLMIVSHDRYFMDRLVDHLFVFEGGGVIRDFPGNYTDYREESKSADSPKDDSTESKFKTQKVKTPSQKLTYKEKMELEKLPHELEKLEAEKENLLTEMSDATGNHDRLRELSEKIDQLTQTIDEKEMRWLELSEKQG